MLSQSSHSSWSPFFKVYDPLKAGSIDGTDTVPHDNAIVRASCAIYTAPDKQVTSSNPHHTLFIGRLNLKTTDRQLEKEFSQYGDVKSCRVVQDIVTGSSRGYAFIEFKWKEDAERAWKKAHSTFLHDRQIIVEWEFARTMPGWIPRRLGGGLGGRKESGQLRFGGRDRPFRRPLIFPREEQTESEISKAAAQKLTGDENYRGDRHFHKSVDKDVSKSGSNVFFRKEKNYDNEYFEKERHKPSSRHYDEDHYSHRKQKPNYQEVYYHDDSYQHGSRSKHTDTFKRENYGQSKYKLKKRHQNEEENEIFHGREMGSKSGSSSRFWGSKRNYAEGQNDGFYQRETDSRHSEKSKYLEDYEKSYVNFSFESSGSDPKLKASKLDEHYYKKEKPSLTHGSDKASYESVIDSNDHHSKKRKHSTADNDNSDHSERHTEHGRSQKKRKRRHRDSSLSDSSEESKEHKKPKKSAKKSKSKKKKKKKKAKIHSEEELSD